MHCQVAITTDRRNFREIYVNESAKRRQLADEFQQAFQRVDLLVCPTSMKSNIPKMDKKCMNNASEYKHRHRQFMYGATKEMFDMEEFASAIYCSNDEWLDDYMTVPASLAGIPAVSFPLGYSVETECPSLQLMGARMRDVSLLRLGEIISEYLRKG
jgi:Asp-tRNA(Asn)/Glu-tRNA(Gln) amidotransferase A subunit family amidase